MTVKELRAELARFPDNMLVGCRTENGAPSDVEVVRVENGLASNFSIDIPEAATTDVDFVLIGTYES